MGFGVPKPQTLIGNRMKHLTTLLCLFTLSNFCLAGEREASGTVEITASAEVLIITTSGSNTGCGNRYWITPDSNNAYKQAMISMLLSAQLAGKKVWVNGEGNCETIYPYNSAYKLANMHLYTN